MKHFTVTILKADQPNLNGHVYQRAVLEKMITEIQNDPGKRGRVFGTIGMPEGISLQIDKISHSVNNLRITEDGDVLGDVVILNTPAGQLAQGMLGQDGKNPLNLSFRTAGIGQISSTGVISDFRLISINLVSDGA